MEKELLTNPCTDYHLSSEDTILSETSGDFILPDYLPEMRKVLRVDTRLIPVGNYQNGDKTEFAGTAMHTLVYTDPKGEIAAVPLDSDYVYKVASPIGLANHSAIDEVEHVLCRPQGPRKLQIKTKIRSIVSSSSTASLPNPIADLPVSIPPSSLEKLHITMPGLHLLSGSSGDLHTADSVAVDGITPDALRMLWCFGDIYLSEVRATNDGVLATGEVWVHAMATSEGATPFSISRRIPFEELIPIDGVNSAYTALARGCVLSIDNEIVEDGAGGSIINMDIDYLLFAEAFVNKETLLTKDVFSTICPMELQKKEHALLSMVYAKNGNFTVTSSTPYENGEEPISSILDATARVLRSSCELSRGKATIAGDYEVCLLCVGNNEDGSSAYSSHVETLPFRIQIDLPSSVLPDDYVAFHVKPIACHAQIDREDINISTEFATEIQITRKCHIELPEEALLAPEFSHDGEKIEESVLTAYYPTSSDSLWSVCKKYGKHLSPVMESNAIPTEVLEDPSNPFFLDGYASILMD